MNKLTPFCTPLDLGEWKAHVHIAHINYQLNVELGYYLVDVNEGGGKKNSIK